MQPFDQVFSLRDFEESEGPSILGSLRYRLRHAVAVDRIKLETNEWKNIHSNSFSYGISESNFNNALATQ